MSCEETHAPTRDRGGGLSYKPHANSGAEKASRPLGRPPRESGLALTSSSAGGREGRTDTCSRKEPGKPPSTQLTPDRQQDSTRRKPKETANFQRPPTILPAAPTGPPSHRPTAAAAARSSSDYRRGEGPEGQPRRAPPASRARPPAPPLPAQPPPPEPGAHRAGRNCVTRGAERAPAARPARWNGTVTGTGHPAPGERGGDVARRRHTAAPPACLPPGRRWGRWRTGVSLRRELSEVKPELASPAAAPGRTDGAGDPHSVPHRERRAPAGPPQVQTGLPAPFPAGVCSPKHTHTHTPPIPRGFAAPEGSGSPGTVLPRSTAGSAARPSRGRRWCRRRLCCGEAEIQRGVCGELKECRRPAGEEVREAVREAGPAARRGGGGGGKGRGGEGKGAGGGALLAEGRNQGAAGWGCPRR